MLESGKRDMRRALRSAVEEKKAELGPAAFKKWFGSKLPAREAPPAVEAMINRPNDAIKRAKRLLGRGPNALISAVQYLRAIAR